MNEWSFVVGALIGSVAWLYQKAWERRIQRTAVYENIVRLLPSVTLSGLDPQKLDQMLEEGRVLWLHAPDNVVLAFQAWMASVQSGDAANEPRLKDEFLAKMRHDLTFRAAVIPRFWSTRMGIGDFPVLHARR